MEEASSFPMHRKTFLSCFFFQLCSTANSKFCFCFTFLIKNLFSNQSLFFNQSLFLTRASLLIRPKVRNFIKKRLQHKRFRVNFVKFLRTSFLENASGGSFLVLFTLMSSFASDCKESSSQLNFFSVTRMK